MDGWIDGEQKQALSLCPQVILSLYAVAAVIKVSSKQIVFNGQFSSFGEKNQNVLMYNLLLWATGSTIRLRVRPCVFPSCDLYL